MSTITLDSNILSALCTPIRTTMPAPADASLTAFATAVLALADTHTDTPAPLPATMPASAQVTPAPKAPKAPKADKPVVATLPNYAGREMACEEGTASKGQRKWLASNTDMSVADIEAISMVDASNWRALVSGRITAAQYNLLP